MLICACVPVDIGTCMCVYILGDMKKATLWLRYHVNLNGVYLRNACMYWGKY